MNRFAARVGRRRSQPLVASLLLLLHGSALVLAACETWHREAHDSQDGASHQCLVTLVQAGGLDQADPEVVSWEVPLRIREGISPHHNAFHSSSDRLLPPGRAPPR